jgi:PLP dependent protein
VNLVEDIKSNINFTKAKIESIARGCNRNASEINLLIVTKAQPVQVVQAAINAGGVLLGESYPEVTQEKIKSLSVNKQIQWHMIGHLQSRKAKIVAEHFAMIHSIDSYKIAEKLNRALSINNKNLPAMLEFNVSGEATKGGWQAGDSKTWDRLIPEIERIMSLQNLRICGLMCMPPLNTDLEKVRPYFVSLRKLQEFLTNRIAELDLRHLSMGTSADYGVAIQEGATYVRIGQGILGQRSARA